MKIVGVGALGIISVCVIGGCGGSSERPGDGSGGASGAGGTHASAGKTAGAGTAQSSGGSGGQTPVPSRTADKMDLVLMVDNSLSMGDKQELLYEAVPVLLRRLAAPVCVDSESRPTGQSAGSQGCPFGSQPEFAPLTDIHVAVVTSSLGSHGGQICDPMRGNPTQDDRAYPLGKVRDGLSSWDSTGFLAWDPSGARNDPPGTTALAELERQLQDMVLQVGEVGCGYESSLEAWYRFLVDPEPPSSVTVALDAGGNPQQTVRGEADRTLIDLRGRFLRPDSLVGIIMLSDENDCSIIDRSQGWLVGTQTLSGQIFRMPRSASVCATDPNDECCRSCAAQTPAGCAVDPACQGTSAKLSPAEDSLNLRCYDQKRRFGFDFLQPTKRYVDALTQMKIQNAAGATVDNPLFAGGERDPSLVFLAGIVGVPWQDLSTEASWPANAPLEYMSYAELRAEGRLDWILPKTPGGFPLDGLMFETPVDRSTIAGLPQTHPGTQFVIAGNVPGAGPGPNGINGKETNNVDGSDLQYACIFPLATPKSNCVDEQSNCSCRPSDASYQRSVCNGTTQTHAKAYPSVRLLEVLAGVGAQTENAVFASICPKVSDPSRRNDPNFGYTPAVSAFIDRIKVALARPAD